MATNSCAHCGTTYGRPPSQLGSYCSKTCGYAALRKEVTTSRRIRYLPSHPLAPPSGLVSAARVTLYEKIGPGEHACHWCSRKITWLVGSRGNLRESVTADHLDSNPLNDSPANLVAACGPCNGTRGGDSIKDGDAYIVRSNGERARAERVTCEGCSESFLVMISRRPGTGRFCSRSCARRQPRKRAS